MRTIYWKACHNARGT